MATRKRRVRSPHPGVVLIKPTGRYTSWRARFQDPDSGRNEWLRLDPAALGTAEARREWAIRKSKTLAKRRMELESGAPRATGLALAEALDRYFKAHAQLRPRTLSIYRSAADKLLAWAGKAHVQSADGLTRAKLLTFRETLVAAPRRAAVKGGKRGAYRPTGKPRSAVAVNQELRSVRTVLGYLRRLDLLPRTSSDDLADALQRLPATTERLEYLKPPQCKKLLEAALRHDAETFDETRAEHAGEGEKGTTARHPAVAPFVAFVLLTGCRFGEALALDWRQVDLDALDHDGRKVGEIHLAGTGTKTRKARTIGLEVSPALHKLLSALRLASGGKGPVFGLSTGTLEAAAKRLRNDYGAPDAFTWQALRRTCGTFLTNAPGIFGASSAYRSAKRLGHSVQIAERHYLGLVRGIPADARTLDAAMQVEDVVSRVASGTGRPAQPPVSAAVWTGAGPARRALRARSK